MSEVFVDIIIISSEFIGFCAAWIFQRKFMVLDLTHFVSMFNFLLTLKHLVSTGRWYIFEQTCSWKLQVCLTIYHLLINMRPERVLLESIEVKRGIIIEWINQMQSSGVGGYSIIKASLDISQNSEKNTYARVSFFFNKVVLIKQNNVSWK